MNTWKIALVTATLFCAQVLTGAAIYRAENRSEITSRQLVSQNKESVLAQQSNRELEIVNVMGASTTCAPCVAKKLESAIATMSAQAVVLGNLETSEVYGKKSSSKPLPIASLTKIMTAVVALENLSLADTVTVSPKCAQVSEINRQLGLKVGHSVSVEDLLYGLLVRSGSDCACALGEALGGQDNLVALMNKKAQNLSLTSTHFQNPVGNDALDNFSTASDLFKLTQYAMQNKVFRKIVGTNYFWNQPTTNQLLLNLAGITGVKTGYTPGAGECLAATWVGDSGKEYLGIVLASKDRFGEVEKLVELSESL